MRICLAKAAATVALVAAALLAAPLQASAADPADAVAVADKCRGINMLAETQAKDPETYAKIMAQAAATENSGPLLWKIERAGRPTSYLFGTVHLTDERVTKLSPAVEQALSQSKTVALEVSDISEKATATGHRAVGATRHVHRRPPARRAAFRHRVRYGQAHHLALRHAVGPRGTVQAVDRHHDHVGVGLRAHERTAGRPRARHEDRRGRQGARPAGRRPRDHPRAAAGACCGSGAPSSSTCCARA